MAGIVRKLFKSAGGGSSRKKKDEERFDEDDDGDYSELHFGPTTSTTMTPSKIFKFCKTPKIRNDETLSGDDDDEEEESDDVKDFRKLPKFGRHSEDITQQHLQIRHQNKPNLKRRRNFDQNFQDPYGSRMFQNEEDSIYEHTQYQLMAYGRQSERHDAKRRKRREEQENRVYDGFGGMQFEEDTVDDDVGRLKRERDQWKREAERYKQKCAELEKILKEMRQKEQFQPFPMSNNPFNTVFPPQAPPPTFLFQATPFNFGANLNFNPNFSFSSSSTAPMTSSTAPPTPSAARSHAPFSSLAPPIGDPMGPVGPMAPRYPDPVDDSLLFEDDDTSLSDLSNSSKSSEEGEQQGK